MDVVDVSGISYFLPILTFLIVFIVVFAVLGKIKFGSTWLQIFLGFFVAAIFVTAFGAVSFFKNITTWFVILTVSGLFLVALLSLFGSKFEKFSHGLGIAFVIIAIIAFLISGMVVYGKYINPYLPWGNGVGDDTAAGNVVGWLYTGRVIGAILLIVVGAIVAFVLSKAK
jgi:hypothetical protein